LKLNASKQKITKLLPKVKSVSALTEPVCKVEYLGYQFVIRDPVNGVDKISNFRPVKVEIADKKVSKIKSRIVRAFRSFAAYPDFDLLRDRVTFLTSNFRIFDKRNGKQRSAGIYYSYPQITEDATSLAELDAYLRHAIFTKKDRALSGVSALLDGKMKRSLLRHSFSTGHQEKSYVYFSTSRISDIQKCWKYE
jgi:hypothetical protein